MKAKISVTVDTELLDEVDRLAEEMSRSQVIERALSAWVRRRAQVRLDRAIERYYEGRTAADAQEDDAWAALGDETAAKAWDE